MKILLADNKIEDRTKLKETLTSWGYEVIERTNGKEALEALTQEDSPKLLVLDAEMPNVSGIEVCQELRFQDHSDYLYTIILSKSTKHSDLIMGLQSGADEFISKPVDLAELQLRIRTGRRIIELQANLLEAQEALRIQATQDFLTRINNRAAIMDILNQEMKRTSRTKNPMGVVMCDIDKFKNINDTYGHPAGDAVIREVAARIKDTLREYDAVGRFGGEEFLIVVPEIGAKDLLSMSNRVREIIANKPMSIPDSEITVTMSFGGAILTGEASLTNDELVAQADAALYEAKEDGRNCSKIASIAV